MTVHAEGCAYRRWLEAGMARGRGPGEQAVVPCDCGAQPPPETSPADPDAACPHEDFAASVAVHRIARSDEDDTIVGYAAEVRVSCAACEEPFRWLGDLPVGLLAGEPTVDVTGYELRAPIVPGSADEDFGMGLGGFVVRQRTGGDDDPLSDEFGGAG